MKYLWLFLSALCIFGVSGATREGDGGKMFQAGSERLSLLLLLSERESRFAAERFPAGEEALRQAMKENPGRYCHKEDARRTLRDVFEQSLRAAYRIEAEEVLRPFENRMTKAEKSRLLAGDHRFFDQRVKALYDTAFDRVRAELAEMQKQKLFHELRPSAEELERRNDTELVALLAGRLQKEQKEPLWEENRELLKREIIAPAIAEGRRQQTLQQQLAKKWPIPAELWDSPAAEAFLTKEIPAAIQKKRQGQFCYPLFTATRRTIAKRAADLPMARAVSAMPHHLPTALYREMVQKKDAGHRYGPQSMQLALAPLSQALITAALEKSAPPAAGRERLVNDPHLRTAAEKRVQDLKHELQSVRDEVAKTQLAEAWPELVKGEWLPEMTETERFAASGSREVPPLKGAPDTAELLRETELDMEKEVRRILATEAARLGAQKAAVEELYGNVQTEMSSLQQNRKQQKPGWLTTLFQSGKNVTLEEVVKFYRAETEKRSTTPLFPSIEQEIEVRARAILLRINPQEPAQKQQPVPKKSEPEKEMEKVVWVIRLSGQSDKLQLHFGDWKMTFPASALPKEALQKEVRRRMAAEKKEVSRQIRFLVNGDKIYYSTVSELRTLLQESATGASIEDEFQK